SLPAGTVKGASRTWRPRRGRGRWARGCLTTADAPAASPRISAETKRAGARNRIAPDGPVSDGGRQAAPSETGGPGSVRGARVPAVGGKPAAVGQLANRFPSQLGGLGVGVLPTVHGRYRDRDLVGELFLRHPQLLAHRTNQVGRVVSH